MTHAGYVFAGYGITFGALAAYVAWQGVRRRALARALEPPAAGEDAGPRPSL